MNNHVKLQEGAHASSGCKLTLDTAFKILSGIQDQIRFADSKAGFHVALMAILFGFTASNMQRIQKLVTEHNTGSFIQSVPFFILLSFYFVTSVAAVVLAILAVKSRLGGEAPQTKVFFGHIVKHYGRDYGKYVKDMKATSDEEWVDQVGTQILEVSNIASKKHYWLGWSSLLAMFAVVSWSLLLLQVLISGI